MQPQITGYVLISKLRLRNKKKIKPTILNINNKIECSISETLLYTLTVIKLTIKSEFAQKKKKKYSKNI